MFLIYLINYLYIVLRTLGLKNPLGRFNKVLLLLFLICTGVLCPGNNNIPAFSLVSSLDLRPQGPFWVWWPFQEMQTFAKFWPCKFQFPSSDPLSSSESLLELPQRLVLLTSVFSLQSPDISLAKSWYFSCISFSLLSTLPSPGTEMSLMRTLLFLLCSHHLLLCGR